MKEEEEEKRERRVQTKTDNFDILFSSRTTYLGRGFLFSEASLFLLSNPFFSDQTERERVSFRSPKPKSLSLCFVRVRNQRVKTLHLFCFVLTSGWLRFVAGLRDGTGWEQGCRVLMEASSQRIFNRKQSEYISWQNYYVIGVFFMWPFEVPPPLAI